MRRVPWWLMVAGVLAARMSVAAQEQAFTDPAMSGPAPAERATVLEYANRPIVELRAHVLSRMPADRAAAAVRALDGLLARGITGPVSTRAIGSARILMVGGEGVVAIMPADIDVVVGENVDRKANEAATRLQAALAEAMELRTPRQLLRGITESVAITVTLILGLWLLRWVGRATARRLTEFAERRTTGTWGGHAMRVTNVTRAVPYVVFGSVVIQAAVLTYLWLAFVLRRFPYTRPWGESLRSLLLDQLARIGTVLVQALPGLCAVALILILAKIASRGVGLLFTAVEEQRLSIPGVYADTAVAMRRLVVALLWLLALAAAYPFVPGSDGAGFKGISVFVGVVISLGSTGVVQHLMSGLMLTFARAMHVGDYARVGDVEGTIVQVGAVATKIRTRYGEEVTIPNAVVVSQTMTNYSRQTAGDNAMLATSITIGYDTPWRQVEALLLAAARCTQGVSRTPPPVVWLSALDDYYVKYTVLVAPEDACARPELLDRLHVRILDAFNEHGVQIMSPHYVADPLRPKVVPQSRWYDTPAAPEPAGRIALRS